MSLSPFNSNAEQAPSTQSKDERLSVSQALLITAGLAGLVGLFIGGLIRFSLANSSNVRFLSPLQTFPALSTWAPELPQGTADSHYLPGGGGLPSRDDSSDYNSGDVKGNEAFPESPQIPTFDEDLESYPNSESYSDPESYFDSENYPPVEGSTWSDETYYYDDEGQQ